MTVNQTEHSSTGTVDTIIHIGAGRCTELPDYLAANPARIVLIEPQSDRARALRHEAAGHGHVTVIEAAIAGSKAGDRLKVFNQSDYSSLREPTGLREIFPGLRTQRELEVDCITPAELFEREALESGQNHWLVIDAPGEESDILEALTASGNLTSFARIDLHCGTTSHFEGSEPASLLLQKLADNGYEVKASDAEINPDRPHWALRRNALKLENQALQERLATRDEELIKAHEQLKQLKEERDARVSERDERAREAEERSQKGAALENQLAESKRENRKLLKEKEELRDRLSSEVAGKEKCLQLANQEIEKIKSQVNFIKNLWPIEQCASSPISYNIEVKTENNTGGE